MFQIVNNSRQATLDAFSRSQAMIEFKPDGTILSANENFLNAMGYDLDEVQGKHHRMFVDPEYADSDEYRHFWRDLNAGKFQAAEFLRLGKGGRRSGSRRPTIRCSIPPARS